MAQAVLWACSVSSLFLFFTPILKMFGSSQGFGMGEASTPAKRVRQEEKQTCVPVTVRILQDAVAARADDSADVLIHGSEAGIVHLVGTVEALVQQTAMTEFQLNDASGRIKVRHYATGASMGEGLEGIKSGRYVSIIGNLRTSPAVHVSAMSLRAVSNPDEVSYHMVEVALATLNLRKPAAAGGFPLAGLGISAGAVSTGPETPAKRLDAGSMISPMKVEAPMQIPEPTIAVKVASGSDLRASVLAVLQQEQEKASDEGVGFASILAKLANGQTSSQKVKDILSHLVEEGEVFTTIDDEHFSVI